MHTISHSSCVLQEERKKEGKKERKKERKKKNIMFRYNSTTILQGISRKKIYIYFQHHTNTDHTAMYQ